MTFETWVRAASSAQSRQVNHFFLNAPLAESTLEAMRTLAHARFK